MGKSNNNSSNSSSSSSTKTSINASTKSTSTATKSSTKSYSPPVAADPIRVASAPAYSAPRASGNVNRDGTALSLNYGESSSPGRAVGSPNQSNNPPPLSSGPDVVAPPGTPGVTAGTVVRRASSLTLDPNPRKTARTGAERIQVKKSPTLERSADKPRDNTCKSRPEDNRPKGGGGGSKSFVPWKGTKYGC